MAVNDALHGREADTVAVEIIWCIKPLKRREQLADVRHIEAGFVVAHEEAFACATDADPGPLSIRPLT